MNRVIQNIQFLLCKVSLCTLYSEIITLIVYQLKLYPGAYVSVLAKGGGGVVSKLDRLTVEKSKIFLSFYCKSRIYLNSLYFETTAHIWRPTETYVWGVPPPTHTPHLLP